MLRAAPTTAAHLLLGVRDHVVMVVDKSKVNASKRGADWCMGAAASAKIVCCVLVFRPQTNNSPACAGSALLAERRVRSSPYPRYWNQG